jgi:hypothetical protein
MLHRILVRLRPIAVTLTLIEVMHSGEVVMLARTAVRLRS